MRYTIATPGKIKDIKIRAEGDGGSRRNVRGRWVCIGEIELETG